MVSKLLTTLSQTMLNKLWLVSNILIIDAHIKVKELILISLELPPSSFLSKETKQNQEKQTIKSHSESIKA
jgi:hypothetical protein